MKAVKKASALLRDRTFRVVCGILLVLVIPAVLTLYTVRVPMKPSDVKLNPTPLGYTVSLLIYLLPVLALHRWFCACFDEGGGILRRGGRLLQRKAASTATPAPERRVDYRRSAYRWTLATLIPIGYALDIIFGHAFLKFENPNATYFGVEGLFPAFDFATRSFRPHIPLEEFIFYTLGFIAILSVYVWCDEYWLKLYNVPDYEEPPKPDGSGLPPFLARVLLLKPLLIAIALVLAAWLYKKFGPHQHHEGFPSYFAFLVAASLLPSILLFRTTQRFINWQAVSLTVFWVALTSMFWEATLAAPYLWWGYKERHMMGLFVGAWFGLPVEAAILWLSVTFTTVMVYETFKILICIRRTRGVGWLTAMFGHDFRAWAREELKPTMAVSDAKDPERALAENASRVSGNRS
jgi:hypothetical protein